MAALVAFQSGEPVSTLHAIVEAQSPWRAVLGLLTLCAGIAERCADSEDLTPEAVIRDVALRIAQTGPGPDE